MAVQLTTRGGAFYDVVIEFLDRIDAMSIEQCLDAYDTIPHIWWKDVTLILRGIDCIDPSVLELLLYLRERANRCSLHLVNCHWDVWRLLEVAAFTKYFDVVAEALQHSENQAMAPEAAQGPDPIGRRDEM